MAVSTTLYQAAHDHDLYKFNFYGATVTTTVTSSPSVITNWIEKAMIELHVTHSPLVGLGVQWRPYTGTTTAATLQLAVGEECLIIQLVHCHDVPGILRDFLYDYIFVGIWNHSDERRLERCVHRLKFGEQPPLDLRRHAFALDGGKKRSLSRKSFARIVAECLDWNGVRLERAVSMSDWEARRLSAAQVKQATADAYGSWSIGCMYDCYLPDSIRYRFMGY